MQRLLVMLCLIFITLGAEPATAQGPVFPVGGCQLLYGEKFTLFSNGMFVQVGNPANAGPAARDPSGMTALTLPSKSPVLRYYVSWTGRVIEVALGLGWKDIGGCLISLPPPVPVIYVPPSAHYGVNIPNVDLAAIPQSIVNSKNLFAAPMLTAEIDVKNCEASEYSNSSDSFKDCVIRRMAGSREVAVYDCARESNSDATRMAICTVGAMGGKKEREVAAQVEECRQNYGNDFRQYPLCMAGKSFDGDVGQLIRCMDQQNATGQISAMGTAVCYGAEKLNLNLNPEAQIAIQCAVATNGEPDAFVACAGGQLSAIELDKCGTYGVGGDKGCFGKNNDIVKHLESGGMEIQAIYGPLNPIVAKWNDAMLQLRNGARDKAIEGLKSIGNELANVGTNAADTATATIARAMPRITVGKPKVSFMGKKFSL